MSPLRRRPLDRQMLVLSFVLTLGVVLIVMGVAGSVTGRDQSSLPDEIEQIQPARGDNVLNQANVVVDLAPGYGGRLEIDGVAYPTVTTQEELPSGGSTPVPTPAEIGPDTVRFDAGTNTLSFQPRPGATVERFEVGRHLVKVVYWRLTEGEANSLSYSWFFDVTA